jgi:hypothetical protein
MAQGRPGTSKTGPRTRKPAAKAERPAETPPPLCSVSFCPICLAVTTASEMRPEFVEHLMSAGREFLVAIRALIDARLEGLDGPVKLERLTIE